MKTVSLSVETVETLGFWSGGKAEGSYRLVLLQEGYEHLSHRLIVEWIKISPASMKSFWMRLPPNQNEGEPADSA